MSKSWADRVNEDDNDEKNEVVDEKKNRVIRDIDDDADGGADGGGDGDENDAPQQLSIQRSTVTSEKDGIKTIEEFFTDQDNRRVKLVKKVRTEHQMVRVKKSVLQRRQWAKFGDCIDCPPGPEANVTMVSIEKIKLDLNGAMRKYIEGLSASVAPKSGPRGPGGGNSIVLCRHCGERGHWTVACPKKNDPNFKGMGGEAASAVAQAPNFADIAKAPAAAPPSSSALSSGDGLGAGRLSRQSSTGGLKQASNAYVPPHARGGNKYANRDDQDRDRNENTLRVSNLSEDASEDDVRELFSCMGPLSRCFLAKDHATMRSRGFAFVTYVRRADAEDAIQKLNGHGYDSLILRVEWAKPREDSKSDA